MVDNKIDAIKKVRSLVHNTRVELNDQTKRYELHFGGDLGECKRLVEDIMALGVRSFLKDAEPLVKMLNDAVKSEQ
jgi:hypothetical protein